MCQICTWFHNCIFIINIHRSKVQCKIPLPLLNLSIVLLPVFYTANHAHPLRVLPRMVVYRNTVFIKKMQKNKFIRRPHG